MKPKASAWDTYLAWAAGYRVDPKELEKAKRKLIRGKPRRRRNAGPRSTGAKGSMAWLFYGLGAVAVYYALKSSGLLGAAATPLSIYPEFAYTARTSMAASPQQKAPAAVVIPTPMYSTVQAQEQEAILSQCVGSYPGCTVLMADTQLGL